MAYRCGAAGTLSKVSAVAVASLLCFTSRHTYMDAVCTWQLLAMDVDLCYVHWASVFGTEID